MQENGDCDTNDKYSVGHIWRGFESSIILTPIQEIKNVKKISLGHSHALILTDDGELYGVGNNSHGQLGNGETSDNFDEPVRIKSLSDKCVTDIACGPRHSGVVLNTGEVYMWGNNDSGQCGVGEKVLFFPKRIEFEECLEECIHGKKKLTSLIYIIQLSCGETHTASLSNKWEIWMWGTGVALGLINNLHTLIPKRLDFLRGKKALSVVCGGYHTLALTSPSDEANEETSGNNSNGENLCSWCNFHQTGQNIQNSGDENFFCPLGLLVHSPSASQISKTLLSNSEEKTNLELVSNDGKEEHVTCENSIAIEKTRNKTGTSKTEGTVENSEFHTIDLHDDVPNKLTSQCCDNETALHSEKKIPSGTELNQADEKGEVGSNGVNQWEIIDTQHLPSSDEANQQTFKIPVRTALKAKLLRSMSETGVGTKILATAKSFDLGKTNESKPRSCSESVATQDNVQDQKESNENEGGDNTETDPQGLPGYQRQKSASLIDSQSAKEYLAQRLSSIASAMSPSALTASKDPVFVYEATTEALRQNVSTLTNMVVSGVMSGVVSGVKNTVDRFSFVSRHLSRDYDVNSMGSLEGEGLYDNLSFEILDTDLLYPDLLYHYHSPQLMKKGFSARAHSLKSELKRKMSRSNRVGSLDTSLDGSQDSGFISSIAWRDSSGDKTALLATEVWTWGRGNMGQLGQGDGMDRLQPCCIKILNNQCVIKVAAGLCHSLALTAGGRVFAWGYNSHGQLGNPEYTVPSYSPKLIKLDSSALVWDIAAGNKHSVLLAEQGLQTGIYYCGKQEGPVPLSGAIGTSHPILVSITNNDFIVRQVFAGGYLCSCIADSTELSHLTAIREFAASERCFYQTLTLLRDTLLDPFSKDPAYSSISSSPYGSSVEELLTAFKNVWEQLALNNHVLGMAIQQSPRDINVLPFIERVVKTDAWISAFECYATAYLDLYAMNGLSFCAKTASSFFGKTQPFKQEAGKTKNLDEKSISEILSRLLEEPIRRIGEYQRSLDVLAEQYKQMKVSHFREIDAAECWGNLAVTVAFEKEMAEKTRLFWESCPSKQADLLRTPKRRLVRDSKTSPLSIHGSGRFSMNWFILFNDILVYSQFSGHTIFSLALVWVDFLSDSEIMQNTFTLTMPEDTLTLQCLTPQDKTEWIHALNQAINLTLNKPNALGSVNLRQFPFGFTGHHLSPPLTRTATYTFTKNPQFKDATYSGTWVRAKLFGHGELIWPDGRKYSGGFKQNVQHGDGLYVVPSTEGNTISEGLWRDGKMNGLGSIRYPNGDLYEGYFKDGLCHGHGILKKGQFVSSAASIYIGEWVSGHRTGYGVMDDIVTGEKYMGMWQDDCRHGNGMVVTLDGIYYEGNFIQNKMMGQGLMIFEDHSWYEGEFGGSGGFNGKGVLTLQGSDIIEGQFYGSWNEGIKVNGMIFKNNITVSSSNYSNSPSSFGQLSVPADKKWEDIFNHCRELLGVADSNEAVNSQRLWETVAVIINDWKKKLQGGSGKVHSRGVDLDGLEKIPQFRRGKLTLEIYHEIRNYLTKAFDSSYHPLGKLMEGLVDVYRATYIGVGAHPRLLIHAEEEVRSFIQRIYKIIRLLFPDLPPENQEQKVRPAAASSPISENSDEDEEVETDIVTAGGLILPILLPRIYPPLFTLYALHNEKDDNKYWETLLRWNKQSDLALMAYLGVDHKFWFTLEDKKTQTDHSMNLSSIKDQHFSQAVDALQHLSTTFSPMEKLQVIHRTFQEINKEVQLALGEDYVWTMDDLFPVFQYVVIRARIRHLGSEVLMIENLMESHLQHGELGIMFTTLKACYFQVKQEQASTN